MDLKDASGLAGDTALTYLNTTGDKRGGVSNYASTTFVFGLSYQVSDAVIKILQDFFHATELGRSFNTALAKVKKEVCVLDQYAQDTVQLPQIVVNSIPADNVQLSFGNRLGQDTYGDEIYDVYGGQVQMSTTVEIYESGKPNVHALADAVFLAFMQYVPDRLLPLLIIQDRKVRFSSARRMPENTVGGEVYRIAFTLQLTSEWRQYMKIETVDMDKINVTATKPETSIR